MLNNSADGVALRKIKALFPLCELTEEHHNSLIGDASLSELDSGDKLPADATSDQLSFLLEGDLIISSSRGEIERLSGGKPRASFPLFKLHTPGLYAQASTPALLLQFNRQKYESLLSAIQPQDDSTNSEIVLSSADGVKSPLSMIFDAYFSGELKLPSLPDVALKIHRAIDDDAVGVRDIAKIVITDPTLSAKLIQVANSPAYRGSNRITTVQDAINRLGLKSAQSLALSLSVERLFNTNSGTCKQIMREVYDHSLLVGCLSYVIAKETAYLNPENALLAGLLHDLGKVAIISSCNKEQFKSYDSAQIINLMNNLRGVAGNIILSSMDFDRDMITVAEEAESWWRDSGEKLDYCDVVVIAQMHSFIGTPMMNKVPQLDSLPAFKKLDLGEFDPKLGVKFLREANSVVQSLQNILR